MQYQINSLCNEKLRLTGFYSCLKKIKENYLVIEMIKKYKYR